MSDDFTKDLIKSLNKDQGGRVAYNLAVDESPTHVRRWVSTGSTLLDYICSNRRGGGLPEGRIVEIFGPPSIGKSHIATQIARSTQSMGGIVVYIDTENATSVENLGMLGVDVSKRFVYVDTPTWRKLEESYRHFILAYNRAVRHSEPLPEPPEGVKIGPGVDDGRGNTDIHGDKRGSKKVRRTQPSTNIDPTASVPPPYGHASQLGQVPCSWQ